MKFICESATVTTKKNEGISDKEKAYYILFVAGPHCLAYCM